MMHTMRHLDLRARRSLSASLPDVSCGVGSSHDVLPMPPLPSSPSRTAATNYNIDDDRWADKMDPVTGSVLFIAPQSETTHDGGLSRPRSSSSCSSVSSMTSDLPYAPSPTTSLRSESFSERSSRMQYRPPDSAPLDHSMITPEPEEGVHMLETAALPSKKTSSLKKIKKAFRRKKSSITVSGSLSDLNEVAMGLHLHSLPSFSEDNNPSFSTPPMTPPVTTTQYGSLGLPLRPSSYYSPMSRRAHRGSTFFEISLDVSQFGLGAHMTPCSLDRLGIVPSRLAKGKFGSTFSLRNPKNAPSVNVPQPVLIRGVLPGSPAAVIQQFYSGDTIMGVDGHSVDLDNIDTVLAGLSDKVVFEMKRGYQRQRLHRSQFSTPTPGGLARLVSGAKDVVRSHSHPSHHHSCLLLYLTLDTKEDDPPGKDILYRWPGSEFEEPSSNLLMQLRGIFLTLADLLKEMTGSRTFCSTITAEGGLVHFGYIKYGHELLLLALPAKLGSPYQVKLLVEKVSSTMELLYGTVHNAFTSSATHWSVDHLLALFFDSVTTPPSGTFDSAPHILSAVPELILPASVKAQCSVSLSSLDAADHTDRPEILSVRRQFILLGSCLFSKGALVISHLGDSDLKDVVQLCMAYRLPELTVAESVSQIVIWKQVFLSRLKTGSQDGKSLLPYGSHFVLIIGLDHLFVAILMEAITPFEAHSPPSVDAVYVDRARSLIMKLRSLFSDYEEYNLPSASLPALNSVDILLASKFSRRASLSLASLPPTAPLQRKASEPVIPSSPILSHIKVNVIGESSDSDDSSSKPSPITHRRTQSLLNLTRPKPKKMNSLQQLKLHARKEAKPSLKSALVPRTPYQLTSGMDNLLLHYLHLSPGRGVMLCPAHPTPPGPVHSELLCTFRETCLTLRESLWGCVEEGVCGVESDSDSESDGWDSDEDDEKSEKISVSPFAPRVSSVIERGVLVQCGIYHPERNKTTHTLNYWVVGRLFEGEGTKTELYVCYQENMSQDCVEMAYRLLFGWIG